MKKLFIIAILVAMIMNIFTPVSKEIENDDWLLDARISTPYGYDLPWKDGLAKAVANGANVILDWANFSDTYQGRFLHFNDSLEDFRNRVEYVHSHYPGVKYMVYIGPLECETVNSDMNMDGRDDDGKNSTYTDHPEWLQVGIDGRKAVFYGSMPGIPFWVDKTSEDTWLSPSNKEFRKIILNEARRIASTGVDAIWFDVPHLCFEFGDGWQNQWSSVDNASRAAFYNDTGLRLPAAPISPDWQNKTWLEFVKWRYKQILDFVRDFYNAVKEGNPDCKLVIETSSDGSVHTTQVASDITRMPHVCDVIAHEYGGPFYETQYYDWLDMMARLKLWHDFDGTAEKPSWLLSYVEHGHINLARFHAALVLTMGFNYYTPGSHWMGDIVDEQFMHDFFDWLSHHDNYFYGWNSNASVAVVYSRYTLDYLDRGSWEGYAYHDGVFGTLMMLLESNIPFEVIPENDLDNLGKYDAVILPDFACMNESQAEKIRQYVANGGKIIAINETSLYTRYGKRRSDFLLHDVFGVSISEAESEKIYENEYGRGKSVFILEPLGRYYYWAAQPWHNYSNRREAEEMREIFLQLIEKAGIEVPYQIEGNAIAIQYEKNNKKMMRILNFKGIKYGNAVPEEQHLEIKIKGNIKNAKLLDFMNGWENVSIEKEGNYSIVSFILHRQATLIYEKNESRLYIRIIKPGRGALYIFDRQIMDIPSGRTIVIGSITIQAATNGEEVEFYIDGEFKYNDSMPPYEWQWNEFAFGNHEIKVVALSNENEAEDAIDVMAFNIGG